MPSKPYPEAFRRDAVELVRSSGKTVAQVARELGLNRETLRLWLRRDQADRGERHDLLTTAEQQELVRLRRENAELRTEREILKAAAAFSPRRRPGDPVSVR
ncbi:MAG TPA: transposase [Actinomycetes bacterium]|jgi:transposase|nr:transposase [Actinomycetes bacterium]